MLKYALTIATVLLLTTSGAMAQQRAVAKACAADVAAKCAGVQPGQGRIKACVQEHFKELSEPCQAMLVKNCPGVKAGGGRIAACMKSHLADVSQDCKDALSRAVAGKT